MTVHEVAVFCGNVKVDNEDKVNLPMVIISNNDYEVITTVNSHKELIHSFSNLENLEIKWFSVEKDRCVKICLK